MSFRLVPKSVTLNDLERRNVVIMVALCNRQTIIFLPCSFFLSSSSSIFFFSAPNVSGRRLDVYHTSTHGVALVRI